jgi:ribosomal protein S18 acetylase RimI-like enzyme
MSLPSVRLRPTTEADLDFVLALEHHADQRPYIGQWSRDEHLRAMARADREHWILERPADAARLGYLIGYDVQASGWGVYVKRIAVADKSRGIGRVALRAFVLHAIDDLGASSVCLAVRHHNARAQRMYAALGFVEVPLDPAARRRVTTEVDPFGDDCLLMRVGAGALRAL